MYSSIEQVRKSLKTDVIDLIVGNDYIEDENLKEEQIKELIAEAIIDADSEIDGYLNKRYATPLLKIPPIINKISKDIAIYNLFSRQGIEEGSREENYFERYKSAIKFLEHVAKGIMDVGNTTNSDNENENIINKPLSSFMTNSNKRIFNRKSLNGM